MGVRTAVGVAIGLAYAAFVVHAARGSQCPARELGPCAQVHALMMRSPTRTATTVRAENPLVSHDSVRHPATIAIGSDEMPPMLAHGRTPAEREMVLAMHARERMQVRP